MKNKLFIILVFIVTSLSLYANADNGLVAYYNFDKGLGDSVHDMSGNANDGKLKPFGGDVNAGPTWVKAKSGAALRFDGKNDNIVCGNSQSLQIRNNLTISAWINTSGSKKDQFIISKCSFDFWLRKNADDGNFCNLSLTTRDAKNDAFDLTAAGKVPVGQWVFVAAVCSSSPQFRKLFVNGELVCSDSKCGPIGLAARENLSLGRFIDQDIWYFSGLMDEVRVYNRPLSDAEIKVSFAAEAASIDMSLSSEAGPEVNIPLTLKGYIGLERKPSTAPILPVPGYLKLHNGVIEVDVSSDSGSISKVISLKKKCLVVDQNEDIYLLDGERISEKEDRATGYRSLNKLSFEVICANPKIIGVEITKNYKLENDRLVKTVYFRGKFKENFGKLIFLRSQLHMDSKFYGNGYFYRPIWSSGGALGMGALPFVSESSIKDPRNFKDSYGCCSVFLQPAMNLGIAQYKFKVNGYYEGLRAESSQRDLIPDVGMFRPGGWETYMTGDVVRDGDFLSVESHIMIFEGDAREFHRLHLSLPGYAELVKPGAKLPDWFYKVKYFAGGGWGNLISAKDSFALKIPPKIASTLCKDEYMIGIISSWCNPGDYPTSGIIYGLDTDKNDYIYETNAEGVRKDVQSCQQIASDHQKMALYTWQASVGNRSKTYMEDRLDWVLRSDGGALVPGGSGDCLNYLKRVATQEQIDWIANQYQGLFDFYKMDYSYIDGGGGGEMVSLYPEKVFTHAYQGVLLGRAIKNVAEVNHSVHLQNVSVHPETSHCGFLETRSDQPLHDKLDWRTLANCYWLSKYYQPYGWTIPLNWADQNYASRSVMYGFPVELNTPWYSFDLSYMFHTGDECMETHGSRIVDGDHVYPNWWAFETNTLESAFLRQGKAYILPMISHTEKEKKEKIIISVSGLDIDPKKPVYMWHIKPLLKHGLNWTAPTPSALETVSRSLDIVKVKADKIVFEKNLRPSRLEMISFSQIPAFVYSVNGRQNDFMLPESRGVSIDGSIGEKQVKLKVSSGASSAQIIVLLPEPLKSASITVNGAKANYKRFRLKEHSFAVISVPIGRSEVVASSSGMKISRDDQLKSPTVNSYFYHALGFYPEVGSPQIKAVKKDGVDCWEITGPGTLINLFNVDMKGTDGASFRLLPGTAEGVFEFATTCGSQRFAKRIPLDFKSWKEFIFPSEALDEKQYSNRFEECNRLFFSVEAGSVYLADFRLLPLSEDRKVTVRDKKKAHVIETKTPPTIDGNLDEDCWRNAEQFSFGESKTSVRLAYDEKNLYVAMKCDDSIYSSPQKITRDDDAICKAPHIEIYLIPKNSNKCFQLVTNPAKDLWDGVYQLGMPATPDKDWNPNWKVASSISWGAYWNAEIAIQFADLGVSRLESGDIWSAGFFRQAVTGLFGWAYSGGAFYQPDENFGEITFAGQ